MDSQVALIWAGATGAAVAAAGAAALYWANPDFLGPGPSPAAVSNSARPASVPTQATLPPPVAAASPAGQATSIPAATSVKPAFDVVSVEPTGETVVAGRAAPNIKVALVDGDRTLAETTSDARGTVRACSRRRCGLAITA